MRIDVVGRGRFGRTIAPLLEAAGHDVRLRGRGEAVEAPVVWLAVPDREIAGAAAAISPGPVVLHASGATEVDVLRPHRPAGSLHPLMTFPGPHAPPDLRGVPAAIAGDPEALDVAREIARSLGLDPFEVPGDRRLYHAAAVMAGNYATVLLAIASESLAAAGVPRERAAGILLPLALQSLRNAPPDPIAALTGPIARGDAAILEQHRTALREAGLDDIAETHAAIAKIALRLRGLRSG